MRYLSLFSGIEAASAAWHPLGWECVGVAEIEPFPCGALAHHYPNVANLGSVTKVALCALMEPEAVGEIAARYPRSRLAREYVRLAALMVAMPPTDLMVFGSPCQDLSVAGKRKGLEGARSGLFFAAAHIGRWLRARKGCRFWLWENVPGAFTSNSGRDFAVVVGAMAGLDAVDVPPKGWGTEGCAVGEEGMVEWSTLDAQWFGVAQRRRRVFAFADFGDWPSRPPVLLEPEGLRGDSSPRREAGQAVAGTLAAGSPRGSGYRNDADTAENLVPVGECERPGVGERWPAEVAPTLNAAFGKKLGLEDQHIRGGAGLFVPSLLAFNANAQTDQMTFDPHAAALTCSQQSAIAFSCNDHGADATAELAPTMRAMGHSDSHANAGHQLAVAIGAYSTKLHNTRSNNAGKIFEERTACLDANSPPPALLTAMQVRRLTPRECERLQAFPDDYTLIPVGKKMAADGPRYKALGNSMCVNVMRWIGARIDLVRLF